MKLSIVSGKLCVAARAIWPLLLIMLTLTGCTSGPPAKYSVVPSGAVAYPGRSYFFGPFAFHRLYSVLPGSSALECPRKILVASTALPKVEVVSCYPDSELGMVQVADALARSFSFLEQASAGSMRFCEVSIGLVGYDIGIYAVNTQSLNRHCARLKMVARWEPKPDPSQSDSALRSIVRNTAHEAYHIALRREGSRERARLTEETEAAIVEFCAAQVALGAAEFSSLVEVVSRPDENDVGSHYFDSLEGDRAASKAIRSGTVAKLAEAAPAGTSRNVLTACAGVLNRRIK